MDYEPAGSKAVDDWEPEGAKIPVRAHVRSPKKKSVAQGLVEALPAAGGLAGGIVGGIGGTIAGVGVGGVPGAVGGATLGGAGGEAAKQLLSPLVGLESPESSMEAAKDIGVQGAIQGASELAGAGVGAAARFGGRVLMRGALKVAPEGAKTAIAAGITATQGGVKKLGQALGAAGAKARAAAAKATSLGLAYHPTDLLHGAQQLAGNAFPQEDMAMINALNDRFLNNHTGLLTPTGLHLIKKELDDLAKPIYAKIARKEPIEAAQLTTAKWAKYVADNARQILNTTVPNYQEANAAAEALIKIEQNVVRAAKKSLVPKLVTGGVGTAAGAVAGAAATPYGGNRLHGAEIGAVVGAAASTPAAMSKASLLTHAPWLQAILRQIPRAGAYASQQ